jgi:hypothetical protein
MVLNKERILNNDLMKNFAFIPELILRKRMTTKNRQHIKDDKHTNYDSKKIFLP